MFGENIFFNERQNQTDIQQHTNLQIRLNNRCPNDKIHKYSALHSKPSSHVDSNFWYTGECAPRENHVNL